MVPEQGSMNMCHILETPPSLKESETYGNWVKEVNQWRKYTSLPKGVQGPAIYSTLKGKAREAVMQLNLDIICSDGGVDCIIELLDKLYVKGDIKLFFEAFSNFENFQRHKDMTVDQFINTFEELVSKSKQSGAEIPSSIKAYKLLKSANLSQTNEVLVKNSIEHLSYETVKTNLIEVLGNTPCKITGVRSSADIKLENENESDVSPLSSHSQREPFCSCVNDDLNEMVVTSNNINSHEVNLFQTNFINEKDLKYFVHESLGCAIVDSGVTATVAGRVWMECYSESLSEK